MNQTLSITDLLNLITSLGTAVNLGLMSREHAKNVWMKALDSSGYNTEKPETKKKLPASSQPPPVPTPVGK